MTFLSSRKGLLWSAPEILRSGGAFCTNFEGDVYSFAIVLQEIITREKPYATTKLTTEGILYFFCLLMCAYNFICNSYCNSPF